MIRIVRALRPDELDELDETDCSSAPRPGAPAMRSGESWPSDSGPDADAIIANFINDL